MSSNLEKALGFNLEAFNYLYVLCDYETLLKKNITLENFLKILKKYDVKLLQYRDKVSDLELQKQNLIFLKQNLNIPIIVNGKTIVTEPLAVKHIKPHDFYVPGDISSAAFFIVAALITPGSDVTIHFFNELVKMKWTSDFPQNDNPQRRIQDIKEKGYTIASRRNGRNY